jgi:hypothetical protein
MDLSRFGAAPPWSLGVEEGLMLVDAETLEPARDGFTRVFGEATDGSSPSCSSRSSRSRRPWWKRRGRPRRSCVRCGARWPSGRRRTALRCSPPARIRPRRGRVPLVPVERYRRLKAQLGPKLYRQHVCGLHVQLSVPDPDTCLRALRGSLAQPAGPPRRLGQLAHLGRRGERPALDPLQILLEMPTGGPPPVLRSWDDWEAAPRGDSKRRHWDAWPRPEYGTLEVRVLDQPTSLQRTAELAAEVQRLVQGGRGVRRPAIRPRRVRGVARCRRSRRGRPGGRAPARARAGSCAPGDRRANARLIAWRPRPRRSRSAASVASAA